MSADVPPGAPGPGLCGVCVHHRWTGNRRGSSFLMCGRSAVDPSFPKYPPLPVRACRGFEPETQAAPESRERDGR